MPSLRPRTENSSSKMGNAPSKSGKPNRRGGRPRSASSRSAKDKPGRKQMSRTTASSDGDSEIGSPQPSTSSGGKHGSNRETPRSTKASKVSSEDDDSIVEIPQTSTSTGEKLKLNLSQNQEPPKSTKRPRTKSPKSSQNRSRKTVKKPKVDVDIGKEIKAFSGPRARKEDNGDFFAVQQVVDMWVGRSDVKEKDTFYLLHFQGMKYPSKKTYPKDQLEKCWIHPSQMWECEQLIKMFEDDRRKAKEEKKLTKPSYYYYELKSKEESTNDINNYVVDGEEIAGKTLRKRNVLVDAETTNGPRSRRRELRYLAERKGFDRGLKAEKILTAMITDDGIGYFVKWKDTDICDLVSSEICKVKIPDLVLSYLIDVVDDIPVIAPSQSV